MSTPTEDTDNAELWIEVVQAKVKELRYGSVQITVHDGRVTQVETIEKTRIGNEARPANRPGASGKQS